MRPPSSLFRRLLAPIAAVTLLGSAACGSTDDRNSGATPTASASTVDSTEPEAATGASDAPTTSSSPAATSSATPDTASDATADSTPGTTAGTTPDTPSSTTLASDPASAAALEAAARAIVAGRAFRLTSSTAQSISSTALGVDTQNELDPARPTVVVEVAANGDQHTYLDLGPLLAPSLVTEELLRSQPRLAVALNRVHLELWTVGDRLIIDATGYQPLADLDPSIDLGAFAPGIGQVDLTELRDRSSSDVVAALIGGNMADPAALAERLPAVLSGLQPVPGDAGALTAATTYGALLEAMGTDAETVARSAATGFAQQTGLELDLVVDFYARFYETLPVTATITIGTDGALASIWYVADLSPLYQAMFAVDTPLEFPDFDENDLADAREAFADTVWTIESLTTFEFDDAITLTPPSGQLEDRTELMLDLLDPVR